MPEPSVADELRALAAKVHSAGDDELAELLYHLEVTVRADHRLAITHFRAMAAAVAEEVKAGRY